jgi:hypothetical protein
MGKTIEVVDTERTTALNINDMAAWKSPMGGPEEFYFRASNGLLFTVKIEHPTGVLGQCDRERFLSIEEAIRRYSREHGHLVNAAAIDELGVPTPGATPSEADADIRFKESVI